LLSDADFLDLIEGNVVAAAVIRIAESDAGPITPVAPSVITLKPSVTAGAIHYALNLWSAMVRYCDDGRIEIDNNAAERALRAIAVGRRNYLFAGSDAGGERAAAIYSLVASAKLNGMDPEAYLRYVLERIADHPIKHIEELLPWKVATNLSRPIELAA
jgi:transposase